MELAHVQHCAPRKVMLNLFASLPSVSAGWMWLVDMIWHMGQALWETNPAVWSRGQVEQGARAGPQPLALAHPCIWEGAWHKGGGMAQPNLAT